jgi:hypothetical protein
VAVLRLRHETLTGQAAGAAADDLFVPDVRPSPDGAGGEVPTLDEGDLTGTVSQATPLADRWAGGTALILVVQGLDDRRAPPGNGWALREQGGTGQITSSRSVPDIRPMGDTWR